MNDPKPRPPNSYHNPDDLDCSCYECVLEVASPAPADPVPAQGERWLEWIEPFGPNNEPVYMRVPASTAIAAMKKAHPKLTDDQALDEFIVVNWATTLNIRREAGAAQDGLREHIRRLLLVIDNANICLGTDCEDSGHKSRGKIVAEAEAALRRER